MTYLTMYDGTSVIVGLSLNIWQSSECFSWPRWLEIHKRRVQRYRVGTAAAVLLGRARASGILEDCVCFSCLILKAPNSLPPLKVIRGAKGLKRSNMGCFLSVHTFTSTCTQYCGSPFLTDKDKD